MSQKQPKLCSECQNICPKCHKKKKASQIIPQYEEYPYYETQEQAQEEEAQVQYEEPQYNEELAYEQEMQTQEQEQEQVQEQEEPYYDQDIQYQYEEEQNTYSQPQYQSKTYQPRYYTLEERKALLQMARPMFTVITYQNMDNNALGTNYYSKNTEPVKRGNNYDINNMKYEYKKEVKTNTTNTEIKKDIKPKEINKDIKPKEINKDIKPKEVNKDIKPKEDKKDIKPKEEKKEIKSKVVKKDENKRMTEWKNQVMKSNKNGESTSRYKRRDGNKVIQKKEKIRQSSVNKNDRGKRHHLTYEFINISVEKKD